MIFIKQIVELTQEDIIKTIANTYNVDVDNVKLTIEKEWMMRRYKVSATITLQENE